MVKTKIVPKVTQADRDEYAETNKKQAAKKEALLASIPPSLRIDEEFPWKEYALMATEKLQKQREDAMKLQTKKKKSDKPPTDKQIASRKRFREKVAEAKLLYADGSNGMPWKDCMSRVYALDKKE
jgi:hypothetical protein